MPAAGVSAMLVGGHRICCSPTNVRAGLDLLELRDAVRGPHDLDPAGVHSGLDAIELDTSSESASGSGSVTGWCG